MRIPSERSVRMTQNQIEFQKLKETRRSNLANEAYNYDKLANDAYQSELSRLMEGYKAAMGSKKFGSGIDAKGYQIGMAAAGYTDPQYRAREGAIRRVPGAWDEMSQFYTSQLGDNPMFSSSMSGKEIRYGRR